GQTHHSWTTIGRAESTASAGCTGSGCYTLAAQGKRGTHRIMAVVSMKLLLEAGVHFGHQTKRWNPKMKPFIFTERNGIHIIDLQQTVTRLAEAYSFVRDLTRRGESVLFVGTKKQAQEAIEEEAKRS